MFDCVVFIGSNTLTHSWAAILNLWFATPTQKTIRKYLHYNS